MLTMVLIAKDNGSGTMEIMSTLPIKNYEYVLGKFLAACFLIFFGLLLTSFHYFTLINVGTNIDHGAIFSGYLGLMLVGAMYAAFIGFISFTNNLNSINILLHFHLHSF